MSRPPREYHPQYLSDRPIDFIGQHYEPTECHNSYVYTQAGFPGFNTPGGQYMPSLPVNAGYTAPTYSQVAAGYPQVAAGYPQVAAGYPQTTIAQPVAQAYQPQTYTPYPARPVESEAVVNERIKANIDAIMETQKTAMLNSKLESLTSKVQSLAENIEHRGSSHVRSLSDKVDRLSRNLSEGESTTHIWSLSEKVDRLSRSLESRPAATESLSSTASSDSDIARRLRRLAAESSARQPRSEERIPDW